MFSSRLNWSSATNRLSRALAERREAGDAIFDLTGSNPTRVDLEYPVDALADALRAGATAPYVADPRGLLSARNVLAAALSTTSDEVDPDDLFLLASTSEAYSYLFKLLGDPGDQIVIARPSYPLLEHIAALEGLRLRHYSLNLSMLRDAKRRRARWTLDVPDVAAAFGERSRAVVVVNPNNPTGNYVTPGEVHELAELCAAKQIPLISDEVFIDYCISDAQPRSLGTLRDGLVFTLGGLSKMVGLPHYKLGWIRVAGGTQAKAAAKSALDLIADSFLSANTPVQVALPEILAAGEDVRAQISSRTRRNLAVLRAALEAFASVELLEPEGGWSAVIRVPHLESDEEVVLQLLSRGVLVQPGFFYDFDREGFLVVSLLGRPSEFDTGVEVLKLYLDERFD